MVKRIAMSMVEGLVALLAGFSPNDPGDLIWSARAAKSLWLKCEGQAISRADYAALYSAIGTTFGVGDGSTTFNLPDGRGRALIGVGTGALAETVAAAAVTVATDLIAVASNVDRWITGMKVRASTTGTLPTGLVAATDYFVIRMSATTIKLATTLANALAGTGIDITAQGSGSHTLTHSLTARALGGLGGEEAHASTIAEMAAHTHTTTEWFYYERGSGGVGGYTAGAIMDRNPVVPSNTGGNLAHNNMPPFLAANLFIFAGV